MARTLVPAQPAPNDGSASAEQTLSDGEVPHVGLPAEVVLGRVRQWKRENSHAESGRLFGYVYTSDGAHYQAVHDAFALFCDEEILPSCQAVKEVVAEAHTLFQHTNALNPTAYPSLLLMETETIAMLAALFHCPDATGGLVTGAAESVLLCVKTYRDWAREQGWRGAVEMVAPATIHPLFHQAAAFFDVTLVTVPVDAEGAVDLKALRRAVSRRTILLLASAPQVVHGTCDPVSALAEIAKDCSLPLHVDCCGGGLLLASSPSQPAFDFRVAGVASLSLDLPRVGWGGRGVGALLFRDADVRRHMIFAYPDWPGGLFASPTMAGTRAGGPMAAAWALLKHAGRDGLDKMAAEVAAARTALCEGVNASPHLAVVGRPCAGLVAFAAKSPQQLDLLAVADGLERCGWEVQRQAHTLAVWLRPGVVARVGQLVADIAKVASEHASPAAEPPRPRAASYRLLAGLQDKAALRSCLIEMMGIVYAPRRRKATA